jgi:phospholipase/lecithinase/hemolysin
VGILLSGFLTFTAQAAFTSFHVFGDTLSAATTNSPIGPQYYGDRWSNGRVWVEVLAQRQGLTFNLAANTNAYFGNTSSNLFAETTAYTPPADASNALVVVWVNNADLYYPALDSPPTIGRFTNVINVAITNQYRAITNLYAKGIRTLIMPNVVDISTVPQFNTYTAYTNLFHQMSTNYNAAFYAMLGKARTNYPSLNIIIPDFYSLLTNLLAQAANYGVTNALKNGLSIDALTELMTPSLTNGPGTNYIFWHPFNPTAKVHGLMASIAQQLISPVQISQLIPLAGSNRLDMVNIPIGLSGSVIVSTNLAQTNWTGVQNISSTNATQTVFLTNSGPLQFYRLRFPYAWSWP